MNKAKEKERCGGGKKNTVSTLTSHNIIGNCYPAIISTQKILEINKMKTAWTSPLQHLGSPLCTSKKTTGRSSFIMSNGKC